MRTEENKTLQTAAPLAVLITVMVFGRLFAAESVRSELVRLEVETGLTLASFSRSVTRVVFADRSVLVGKEILPIGTGLEGAISRDGTEIALMLWKSQSRPVLGVMRNDGSGLREYPNLIQPNQICWSYDKTKLALVADHRNKDGRRGGFELVILSLKSGDTRVVDANGFLTSQCWSPDGRKLVYSSNGTVSVYDQESSKTRTLAKGSNPTWSTDGNWIAFLDDDTYYAIRPTGMERRILFKRKGALSGLWWSPGSQIVAYISRTEPSEGGPFVIDVEMARLRVRRLSDNAEDWVGEFGEPVMPNFQWVNTGNLDNH